VVQPLHDRTPVIIPERDYGRWLTSDPERPPIDFLRPFDADKMTAWKVDTAVGNVKNDRPELIDQIQQAAVLAIRCVRRLLQATKDRLWSIALQAGQTGTRPVR
jgi:hypothetical protein